MIVEGYTDYLTLFQNGFCNVTATLGTALTLYHARLLKRYTDKVVLFFDGDQAGEKATLRSLPILLKTGLRVHQAELKDMDPDECIQKKGSEFLKKIIAQNNDLFLHTFSKKLEHKQGVERLDVIREFQPILSETKDTALKEYYSQFILSAFTPAEQKTARILLSQKHSLKKMAQTQEPESSTISDPEMYVKIDISQLPKTELYLLVLSLHKDYYLEYMARHLNIEMLSHSDLQKTFSFILKNYAENPSNFDKLFNRVMARIKPEKLLYTHYHPVLAHLTKETGIKLIKDCLSRLVLNYENSRIKTLTMQLKLNQVDNKKYLEEIQNIKRKILSVEHSHGKINQKRKTLSVKAQMELVQQETARFISLFESRKKTAFTYDEVNELLSPEIISAQAIDEFMSAMEKNKISFQKSSSSKQKDASDTDFFLSEVDDMNEENAEEEKEEYKDYSSNDPVRLYLRKMGNVSLLDREGEVKIACEIEKGEREIIRAMLMTPIGTHEVISIGENMKKNRIKIKSIFRGLEDENHQYNESEYIEKIFELIGHVQVYQKQAEQYFSQIREKGLNHCPESLSALSKLVDVLMEKFKAVNFNRKIINRISNKFRNLLTRMGELKKRKESALQKTFSEDFSALEKKYELMLSDQERSEQIERETGLNFKRLREFYLSYKDASKRLERVHKETWMNMAWVRSVCTAIWKGETGGG